jgi:hypothetical protein
MSALAMQTSSQNKIAQMHGGQRRVIVPHYNHRHGPGLGSSRCAYP